MYQEYCVSLASTRGLLMHSDDLAWAGVLKKWLSVPANKKGVERGDDRTPGFACLGSFWRDPNNNVIIPAHALVAMLAKAGTEFSGGGRKSLKAAAVTGLKVDDTPILIGGKQVNVTSLFDMALKDGVTDFEAYQQEALNLGFILDIRRARIGTNKHVRVRPRFNGWTANLNVAVTDPRFTVEQVSDLFALAGLSVGLGDWRPSSGRPGVHGTFAVTSVKEVK